MGVAQSYSLSELLTQAVDSLPLLRRKVIQRRFRRNPDYRQAVLDEIAIKLVDDERAVEILGAQFCEQLLSGDCTVETAFEVDRLDNLERLLKIIVEYLPAILAIVMRLFGGFVLLFALLTFSLVASTASAQHWSFPGTIENHLRSGHGVNTRGMSYAQMLAQHDQLHNSQSPRQYQPVRRLRLFRR